MKNESEIHRCRECRYLQATEEGIVKYAIGLLNDFQTKKGVLPKERFDELLRKMVHKKVEIGTKCCEKGDQIIPTLSICDKVNKFSPRRNLRYWFTTLQKAVSHFQI